MATNSTVGMVVMVESTDVLPATEHRIGRLLFRTTDKTLHRWSGTAWDKIAASTDPPAPHQTSHQDGGADPLRGIMKLDGIEATAVPNTLGASAATGHITYSQGKGVIIRSPNGHRWLIVVNNVGSLSANDLDA